MFDDCEHQTCSDMFHYTCTMVRLIAKSLINILDSLEPSLFFLGGGGGGGGGLGSRLHPGVLDQ